MKKVIKLVRKLGKNEEKFCYTWGIGKCRIVYSLLISDRPLTAHDISVMWNRSVDIARHEWNKIDPECRELKEIGIVIDQEGRGYILNYERFAFCFLSSTLHIYKGESQILLNDISRIPEEKIKRIANCFRTEIFKNILIGFLSKKDMVKAKNKELGIMNEETGKRELPLFKENIFTRIQIIFLRFSEACIPNFYKMFKPDITKVENYLSTEANIENYLSTEANTNCYLKNIFYDKVKEEYVPKPFDKEFAEGIVAFNEVAQPKFKKLDIKEISEFIENVMFLKTLE